MCIRCKAGVKGSMNFAFISVFKPHTHKPYILRHCTIIVYVCCCANVMTYSNCAETNVMTYSNCAETNAMTYSTYTEIHVYVATTVSLALNEDTKRT